MTGCVSPGDLRRASAATERLCLLVGEECPWERRDAAVLLLHAGQKTQAAVELDAYARSSWFRSHASAEEARLVERLQPLCSSVMGAPDSCFCSRTLIFGLTEMRWTSCSTCQGTRLGEQVMREVESGKTLQISQLMI